jgi:hypothetical protein
VYPFVKSFIGFSGSFQRQALKLNHQVAIYGKLIHSHAGVALRSTTLSMTVESYKVGVAASNPVLVVTALLIMVCNRPWLSNYDNTDDVYSMS